MSSGNESGKMDLEWENRVLCSDEGCIGTIGPDGRCRECGRPYEGTLPVMPAEDQMDDAAASSDGTADAAGDPQTLQGDDAAFDESSSDDYQAITSDDEWERRTLCPDESCIGVIGPDGRCKECGKPNHR